MQVDVKALKSIIEGTNQFRVPHFQRPYSWGKTEWNALWTDLDELLQEAEEEPDAERRRRHFLGSMVTMPAQSVPAGITKFLLIDGQQRLTTLLILLAALRDKAKSDGDETLAQRIQHIYLTNQYQEGNDCFKLLPTEGDPNVGGDRAPFITCMNGGKLKADSAIGTAWSFFESNVQRLDRDSAKMLVDVIISQLELVTIGLQTNDNPYAIFESLNAKGRPLTQADLVRNYFFMRTHERHHDTMYRADWHPMEASLGPDGMTEFLRQFVIMRVERQVRADAVYLTLKARFDDLPEDTVRLELASLVRYAKHFVRLIGPRENETNPELRKRVERLNTHEATVAYPFLLAVYEAQANGDMDVTEVIDVLDAIENFLVRRYVCGVPRPELNKYFVTLFRLAKRQGGLDGLRRLATAVRNLLAARRYPSDEEFRDALIRRKLYGPRDVARLRLVLNPILLGTVHREQVDPSNLTIEHLLPQTLTDEWVVRLGADAEQLHTRWLHTLGNLSITAYNAELSNADWPTKREALAMSNLDENRALSNFETWDATTIEERGTRLAKSALKIWPHVAPQTKTPSRVAGRTPRALLMFGDRIEVSSWQDVLRETLERIALLAPECLPELAKDYPAQLHRNTTHFRTSRQLRDDWYYETNLNADSIYTNCQTFAQYAGLASDWDVEIQ